MPNDRINHLGRNAIPQSCDLSENAGNVCAYARKIHNMFSNENPFLQSKFIFIIIIERCLFYTGIFYKIETSERRDIPYVCLEQPTRY